MNLSQTQTQQSGPRGSDGGRAPCLRSTQDRESTHKKKKRGGRGRRKGRKRRAGARKDQWKVERLGKSHLRILYWNCGSLNTRPATAEKLAYSADIVCLQETQKHTIKPAGFSAPVLNNRGHGQLILLRKEIKHKELDLSQWTNDNLHLVGVELSDQPVRNVINVYAVNKTMKVEDWMVLDKIQSTLPGESVLCGDFNARGSLWGNVITNPQGEALEDALDQCNLTCINDGSMTRQATRDGDSDSAIDLAITTLGIAMHCKWQSLGKVSNDHYPCTVLAKRQKVLSCPRRKKVFTYEKQEDDLISSVRQKASARAPNTTINKSVRQQPPWFTDEVKELWEKKRQALKRASRKRDDKELKVEANKAADDFEKAAKNTKAAIYDEFSQKVSEDKSLYKFWQLHAAMNRAKKHSVVPDFRREDDVWMRTEEEKGEAFFKRYLEQTDQKNAPTRRELLGSLRTGYGRQLLWPCTEITPEGLKSTIKNASDSAPGPDSIAYSHLETLNEEDLSKLAAVLTKSVEDGEIPEDWLDSHLSPVPKPGKDQASIKGYRIITMQNTIGKLLEKIVARRLARELEEKELLPPTLGSYRTGKDTWMNAAVLAADVYEGFERKEETIVIALDLEDAYNRVQYDVLMRTLARLDVSPFLVMWIGAALLERKVALRIGRWTSEIETIAPGLPQGSALSPVLFNVYTMGITSNQLEGPGRTLSFADDVLVYRSGRNREEIAESAQTEIDRIGGWCDSHNGKLHPDKACVLWCSLNNHAVKAVMPTVSIQGKDLQREQCLKYLGVTFDRSLSFNIHITNVIKKARKGLTAVKTMAAAQMPQHTLLILYKALVLSVIDYGFGLLTLSAAQLQRLEVIQNEGMRSILGCTRDTSAEAMRYLLDLPSMPDRHKLAQVKAFGRVSADPGNPLHNKIGQPVNCRLKRGTSWMTQASRTIETCTAIENVRRGEAWSSIEDEDERFTLVISTLGRECREWAPGAAHAEVESLIADYCQEDDDCVIFTDGSVVRGTKSGWAFAARVKGAIIAEGSDATELTLSSMQTEINAITLALSWAKHQLFSHIIIVSDSLSTLEKIRGRHLHADWMQHINDSLIRKITWIFCPGHAGVAGNEHVDKLAGEAAISDNKVLLDPQAFVGMVASHMSDVQDNKPSSSHTLQVIKDSGTKRGAGVKCLLRGPNRRRANQLLCNTVSVSTLKYGPARSALTLIATSSNLK